MRQGHRVRFTGYRGRKPDQTPIEVGCLGHLLSRDGECWQVMFSFRPAIDLVPAVELELLEEDRELRAHIARVLKEEVHE